MNKVQERKMGSGAAAVLEEPEVLEDEDDYAIQDEVVVSPKKFDPSLYLRDLKGQRYLDVKWRLVWLRSEHPKATISTQEIKIDPAGAIFKATVTLPDGASATGFGSETKGDFGDYIEKAETKAIGRALAHMGYGTQFAGEDGEFVSPNATGVRSSSASRPSGYSGRNSSNSSNYGRR